MLRVKHRSTFNVSTPSGMSSNDNFCSKENMPLSSSNNNTTKQELSAGLAIEDVELSINPPPAAKPRNKN